ncbi:LuxR C-terminal-related transcriptional regulator [Streptomyces sp. NPDC051976]|uniref:helix-turn-helix transcriptional regulator n=1 Tax=Streptomyces sp. NPDC051976 TaxID=3154947 RepID=UPI00343E1465
MSASARGLVGRDVEVRALQAALREVRSGQGRAIALVGEPGIGKSALMSTLTAHARASGIPLRASHGCDADPPDIPHIPPAEGGDGHQRAAGSSAGDAVVATVDDLHRLAAERIPAVQELIRSVAARPALLVLAYRERQLSPALAFVLARASSAGLLDVWRLGPLSLEHARELLGDQPDLDDLHRVGLGNPQYLKAVAAHGEARAEAGTAILGELAELTLPALTVARAAAVLGEPFHPELVAEVAGMDVAGTVRALDELTRLDLVRTAGSTSQLALRHEAVADVVYQRLELSHRTEMHLRAEAALAKRAAPIARRAHHVARAADPNQPDHVTTLIAAAREALHTAPAQAAAHLEAATSLLQPGEAYWHEAQVLLARAHLLTGKVVEGRALLHALRAQTPGHAPLDPTAAADAGRAEQRLGRYTEAAAIARSGLAALPDGDNVAAAVLHTELADAALDQQQYETARQHADTAAAIARRHHDRVGEAMALAQGSLAHLFTADHAAAEDAAARAAEIIDATADATVLTNLQSVYQLGITESTLEQLTEAERHLTRGAALARRAGQNSILSPMLKTLAEVQLHSGHLERSLATLDEAAHYAEHSGRTPTQAIVTALRARALLWRGDEGDRREALALSERAAAMAYGPPTAWAVMVRCFHAEVVLLTGDPARGGWLLMDAVGGTELPRLTTWRKPRWCDPLAQLARIEGDRTAAREWARLGEHSVEQLPSPGRRGFAQRARMRAHALHGDLDQAASSAQHAVEGFATAGKRIEVGRTLVAMAALSLDAGRTDDVESRLERAAFLAGQCGSRRLADDVAHERGRLATLAGRERRVDALATLSAREREIAGLAGTGMTTRAIADTLFLSARTVDTHLGRIYSKLGVPNRAALASVLMKRDAEQ